MVLTHITYKSTGIEQRSGYGESEVFILFLKVSFVVVPRLTTCFSQCFEILTGDHLNVAILQAGCYIGKT